MNFKVIAWKEDGKVKLSHLAPKAIREGMDLDTFYQYCIQRIVPEDALHTVELINRSDLPKTRANRDKWQLVGGKIKVGA